MNMQSFYFRATNYISNKVEYISSHSFLVFILLFLLNMPLMISTWDTGWFSDDYQIFHLNQTKYAISSLNRMILDILTPRSDFHFIPFHNLINFILIKIHNSHQWVHFVVVFCYIMTAFFIFLIVKHTHQDKKIGLLAGVLLSLGYCLSFKSLVFHCLHYNITNGLTGIIAFYFALKYMTHGTKGYLFLIFLFLLFTIFNYETGLVFPVIIGIFTLFALKKRKISLYTARVMFLSLIMVVALYVAGNLFFTGKFIPILHERITSVHNEAQHPSNTLSGKRSTYAPRTMSVFAMRAVDLTLGIVNLSIIESKVKPIIKSYIHNKAAKEHERVTLKNKIESYVSKAMIFGGIFLVIVLAFMFWLIFKHLGSSSQPYLFTFLILFFSFTLVYNRIDIANSIAIFSSVIFADIALTLVRKGGNLRKAGILFLLFLIVTPSLIIINGFEDVYPFGKKTMHEQSRVYLKINQTIGHYTENAIVFCHQNSIIAHPAMGPQPTPWMDLSHLNIRMFQDEFLDSKLAKEYATRSLEEFQHAKEIHKHIKTMLVSSQFEALDYIEKHQIDRQKVELIYADEDNTILKI